MTGSPGRRGRPRDATRDRALLDATLAILGEIGYGGLTTAAVAARAGVSTATLYRRWPSKEGLVVAAAAAYAQELTSATDTGTLAGDLRALLRDKAASMTGKEGGVLRSLIAEAANNVPLAEALTNSFVTPVRQLAVEIVHHAVARGEISPVEHADLLGDLVIGPMMSKFFLTPRMPDEVDAAAAAETADRLLPFLLRAVGGTEQR
ncbi:TetR/AcrR family transcriptional regulator [Streptomyces turgidiscabies]|uniref:Transcriptional regulator, TetR family n=1 Tax=Streptomyces turgidiscabies (strain Car8) TaxID=698760 RepID=L7EVB8_STRT8|nr:MULTISPECIES: TetR/AcrR family transcriptional regulator [Streptomyces]ELP62616.1 transcriptional regulator, TetR family [Streptomyces turgidiscabies Car8]MDX3496112.1 TetR/AcrR family transcriptional regulator [Streptomyces turgidiscabies]GAQ75394.1 HTH-type transcriptional repressor KstR [Streptomyces turgidiscabies]